MLGCGTGRRAPPSGLAGHPARGSAPRRILLFLRFPNRAGQCESARRASSSRAPGASCSRPEPPVPVPRTSHGVAAGGKSVLIVRPADRCAAGKLGDPRAGWNPGVGEGARRARRAPVEGRKRAAGHGPRRGARGRPASGSTCGVVRARTIHVEPWHPAAGRSARIGRRGGGATSVSIALFVFPLRAAGERAVPVGGFHPARRGRGPRRPFGLVGLSMFRRPCRRRGLRLGLRFQLGGCQAGLAGRGWRMCRESSFCGGGADRLDVRPRRILGGLLRLRRAIGGGRVGVFSMGNRRLLPTTGEFPFTPANSNLLLAPGCTLP